MQARELIELAAIVSSHGPVLIQSSSPVSEAAIERYWVASKCRLDRWGIALKELSGQTIGRSSAFERASSVYGLLEEILTGEVLTRVWTAVICAHDRHRGTNLSEPIVRSILIGQLEARHRVLTLLVRGPAIDAESAVRLNHLRRRAERWTDMLVGYLAGLHDVDEFAFDPERAADFAVDLRYQNRLPGGRHAWTLIVASLQAGFKQGLGSTSPNPDLNGQIATSVLSCFPSDVFDSTGRFRSLWQVRLANAADDAQGMLDELACRELPELPTADAVIGRRDNRLRRFGD